MKITIPVGQIIEFGPDGLVIEADLADVLSEIDNDDISDYCRNHEIEGYCDCEDHSGEAYEEGKRDGIEEAERTDLEPHVRAKYAGQPIPEPVKELVYEVAGVLL